MASCPCFSHLSLALDAAEHGPLLETLPFPSFIINPCLSAPLFPGTLAPPSPLGHLAQVAGVFLNSLSREDGAEGPGPIFLPSPSNVSEEERVPEEVL